MNANVVHPAPDQLAAYGLGTLDDAKASAVTEHLEACEVCRRTVAETPSDTFLEILRAAKPTPVTPDSAAPSQAGALRSLPASRVAATTGAPALPPELAGHARFRILAELGRGGMGVVYKAEHKLMERPVAIKVISKALLDHPQALERFHREVRAAAKLDHPNIVRAYDAEQAGDLHMLVMELVDGLDLGKVVERKGPLPVLHSCHYVRQVALGLQHAFEKGMVHRDLKPQNLMLTPHKGTVKILDFGLAQLASERQPGKGLTAQNAVMGTPEYMAPEQATDAGSADIRADLYSLGCTLYYLLADRPPFAEETPVKLILAHREKEPTPLHIVRPEVPLALSAVVAKLMAKEPAQRYQTPKEVADALATFCRPEAHIAPETPAVALPAGATNFEPMPAPAASVSPPPPAAADSWEELAAASLELQRTKRSGTRHAAFGLRAGGRRWWLAGGVAAAAIIMAAGIIIWLKTRDGIVVLEIGQSEVDVFVDGEKVKITSRRGSDAVEVRVRPGLRKLEIHKSGFLVETYDITVTAGERSKPITVQLRPNLVARPGESAVVIRPRSEKSPQPDAEAATPKPGGTMGPVNPWARATKTQVPVRERLNEVQLTGLSADGKCLIGIVAEDTVKVWDTTTGQELHAFRESPKMVRTAAVSPDGRRVAYGLADRTTIGSLDFNTPKSTVRVWDGTTRTFLLDEAFGGPVVNQVAFSPDGKHLAVATGQAGGGGASVWDLGSGGRTNQRTSFGTFHSLVFNAKGMQLAIGGWNRLRICDPASGLPIHQLDAEMKVDERGASVNDRRIRGLALSGDGMLLACALQERAVQVWDAGTGRLAYTLTGHTNSVSVVGFGRDSRYLMSFGDDRTLRVWDLTTRDQCPPVEGFSSGVLSVAFDQRGDHVAVLDSEAIHVWRWPVGDVGHRR